MNISKNMEAIFLIAAALACFTGQASANAEPAAAAAPAKVAHTQVDGVQTVTITAKRLPDGV